MTRFLRRLSYWLRQRRIEAELEEELEFHRAARQADLEAAGLPQAAARGAAQRALGNVTRAREDARGIWIWPWLESVWQDVRNAARALRREPSFSLVVALTLGLGIGLNATVFGMADALLLRPFQFRDYERIVVLREVRRGASEREAVAPATFLEWRKQARSFDSLAAWENWGVNLTGGGEAQRLQGARVSAGYFELLSVRPSIGHPFAAHQEQGSVDRRVIISDGLWKRRFGGDPTIVGTQILLEGEPYAVIGVAPAEFEFPVASEIWTPLTFDPDRAADREHRTLTVLGKLASGISLQGARAEMDVIARRLAQQHPASNRDRFASVETISDAFREGITGPLVAILQAAAGLVLVVACANLVGLLLARAMDRQRELAMRTALGAGRMRLIRQLVTETALLGLLSSVLALLFARVGLDALKASMPADAARYTEGWYNLRLDTRLILVTPVFAIVVGVLVGLIPALSASRANLTETLKDGDRGTVGNLGRPRARQALVAAEIAFALAVLVGAGLTVAAGMRLVAQPGGFDPHRLVTLDLSVPEKKYAEAGARRELARAVLTSMQASPGVEEVALTSILPAAGWSPSTSLAIEHQPVLESAAAPQAGYQIVTETYFKTMGIPLIGGRAFSSLDHQESQPVAIVSASLAKRFWPGADVLGRRVQLGDAKEWRTIVGVAGDVTMYNWWDGVDFLRVYVPLQQVDPGGLLAAAVRTRGDLQAIATSLRERILSVDPQLPVQRVRTMERAISDSSLGLSFLGTLMAICGSIAALLAIVGIYGTMAYAVSLRTREFGVRIALGGTTRDMLRLALRQAGALTAIGLAAGCGIAVLFGWLLASALFGLVELDAMTFVIAGLGLGVVSLGAAYLPARRTLRLDPATILRG